MRCISADWITINCTVPGKEYDSYDKISGQYTIKKMAYQTRHFKAVYEIFIKDRRVATLACDPHSDILKFDSGLLKLDNDTLYQIGLTDYVKKLLKDLCLSFNSYSRLDIALDFYTFARGLKCESFIKNFLNSDYAKGGRKTQYRISGETKTDDDFGELVKLQTIGRKRKRRDCVSLQTLKFGSLQSDTTYYLYNKTDELRQVKMKPWICDNWTANGWDGKTDVWRLEFSMSSNNDAIVNPVTGEAVTFKQIEAIDHMDTIYKFMLKRYFTFYHNEKKRKDRNKLVTLFPKDFQTDCVKIKLSDKKDSSRSSKIFAKALSQTNDELRGNDFHLAIYGNEYLTHFIRTRGLDDWAKKKLIGYQPDQRQEAKEASNVNAMMMQTDVDFETLDFIRKVKNRAFGLRNKNLCEPMQLSKTLKSNKQ